mgnify:CR=1 FL=1
MYTGKDSWKRSEINSIKCSPSKGGCKVEIGSEFWITEQQYDDAGLSAPPWMNWGEDRKLLLSGRTAIDYVLKDIMKFRKVENIYFPSYCCQSMLQPFLAQGMNIILYDVYYDDGSLQFNIDVNQDCDIFFAMNYFGFSMGRIDYFIERFKQRNVIVIEDSTHCLLSDKSYHSKSDYIIASLRKWFPVISGGIAVKTEGHFQIDVLDEPPDVMIQIKKEAMLEKASYIATKRFIDKNSYLEKYRVSNQMLELDYCLYKMDRESVRILNSLNVASIKDARRRNAKVLIEGLRNRFRFIFYELDVHDCPIFVPVLFDNQEDRDKLRNHLIAHQIYCPVHWPVPTVINKSSHRSLETLYNHELSLVIDQRYVCSDMHRIIRRIDQYYGEVQ